MPQHGKKQVHQENVGHQPHHMRHEGEQEPGYTDLALEEGHDLIYRAEEEAHMHDDEKNMPKSAGATSGPGMMTKDMKAKMMMPEGSATSENMPQGGSSSMGMGSSGMGSSGMGSSGMGGTGQQQQQQQSSGSGSSGGGGGGMGHKMTEEMKKGMEGVGKKMEGMKEGMKEGMGMGGGSKK
ncbi:uncharacterized protein B0T23DRAFT_422239 [Neurospora hispaniola]|uniref:Uncharacterized protein n=1 Tax=Neurospora hispaniola TaxID=588809 RepID=A0AAJ0I4X1_9PEZI|nr:hypothetical protein B0T23DRAFT_422239 [Neurospora hispaniola]